MAAPAGLSQEAAAPIRRISPAPSEEAPSPTPEPQPEETPRPTPETRSTPPPTAPSPPDAKPEPTITLEQRPATGPAEATPSTTETPAAKPEPARTSASSRSRRVINEKPVRAVEPRDRRPWDDNFAPTGITRPTFDLSKRASGSVGSKLKALENQWQAAIMKGDANAIGKLVADDFVGTSSTGKVGSRSTLLAAVRRDKNTYKSATARSMSVRSLGPDVAVVTGVATEVGTTPDGKNFRVSRRFTDTWRERNGKWQCVASQATAISKN